MRLTLVFLSALIFVLISINLNAQVDSKKVFTQNGTTFSINSVNEKKGKPVNYLVVEHPQQSSQQSNEKRLIVKFKSEPLAKNTLSAQGKRVSLDNEHQRFLEDLQLLQQSKSARSAPSTKILNEYKTVFNGFSIVASSEIEQHIKNLPYIKSVTEDKKVETVDQTSNQIISADRVWTELNITGRGVVIGIIDTGIDYTHPDLGGGMGATSKVIGGYDFVNDDPDPIDDHGHGTHVAGIAAANGAIKGVAPDAKLMAFKVLTAEGWGYDSWILAAIERTVDPDQNPNTDDAPDVVNMSLGRNTDPAEPFSEAISNATSLGVTFVVSAGNNYDYQTVGTPGVAESAITVGATDNFDLAANFSSKGPTENDYRIKPDVCAPGVGIYSTFLNSAYETLSGTSMASPHVAGAVALLLEKNPTWTPEIIKGVLMQTAENTLYNLWTQGAGRINVLDAIQQEIVITSGSISLGLLDNAEENWSKTITVSATNLSDQEKNIFFHIDGNVVQSAIAHTISPSSLTISPMETSIVTITFEITTSQLPFLDFVSGYFGKLVASFDGSTIETDIALVNPKRIKINMTGELPIVIIAVGADEWNPTWKAFYPTYSPINIMLPDGSYDLTAQYSSSRYVTREGLSNSGEIELNKSEAINHIVFKPLNKEGSQIDIANYNHFGTVNLFAHNLITFAPFLDDTIFISNSNKYKIDFNITDTLKSVPGTLYNISKTTGVGIFGSTVLSNNPDDFTEIYVSVPDDEPLSDLHLTHYTQTGIRGSVISTIWNSNPIPVKNPLRILYSKNEPSEIEEDLFVKLESVSGEKKPWESGGFKAIKPEGLIFYNRAIYPLYPIDTLYNISQFNYPLGQTLSHWSGQVFIHENQIFISSYFDGLFNHHYSDRQNNDVHYTMRDNNGTSIQEGSIQNGTFENPSIVLDSSLPFGQLIFEYNHTEFFESQQKSKVTLNFNENNLSKDPPLIKLLSLEDNGVSGNRAYSDKSQLRYSVINNFLDQEPGIKSSTLSIRKSGETIWKVLPTIFNLETNIHTTELTDLSGHYDIKIFAEDLDGNSLTYELVPAFLAEMSTTDQGMKMAYAYPNPLVDQAQINFYISNPGEVSFEIFNAQGQLITQFTSHFEKIGQNSIALTDEFKTQGLFFCRVTSADKMETIKMVVSR